MDVATLAAQFDELRMQTQQLVVAHQAEVSARKEAEAKCERYKQLYEEVLERCKVLENGIIAGQKAERLSPNEAQLPFRPFASLQHPTDQDEFGDGANRFYLMVVRQGRFVNAE